MKKYLISTLIAPILILGSLFTINTTLAAEMSVRDFVNLLITIGVIQQDKIPAVNAWLASLNPVTGGGSASGSSSISGSGSGVSSPVNVTAVSTLTLDSQTPSWQGTAVSVPNTQSFLDLSFTEIGSCASTAYSKVSVYIYAGTLAGQEVRYREIQAGEKANFHIDLHNFQGQTIYPKITFNNANAGSCFKLKIDRNEVKSRDTLFPDWAIAERNILKNNFLDTSNKGLGINDMFDSQNLNFVDEEKVALTAKVLKAKSLRQWFSPQINFSTCTAGNYYSCFDSNELNVTDGFVESLIDRGIAPVQLITPVMFKTISDNEKTSFLNIFKYKDSHYVDSSNWTCPNTTATQNFNNGGNFNSPYARFDLSNWYQYSIPEILVNRYKNGIPAIDVGNEFNIGPHLYSCTPTYDYNGNGVYDWGDYSLNTTEVNDMFSAYSGFTKYFCDEAKSNNQVSIFGGLAYVSANGNGGFATMKIDDTLKKMAAGSFSGCDLIGIHDYSGSGMTKGQYFSTLGDVLTQIKSVWNKKIVISEFGYGSGTVPPNNSAFPNIISEIGNYLKTNSDILTAQYYLVLRRDWMHWYPYWADYGATSMINENYQPNQPFYNQFKNANLAPTPRVCTSFTYTTWSPAVCPSSGQQTRTVSASSPSGCSGGNSVLTQPCTYIPPVTQEICNNIDDNGNGKTDEGCDDDYDHYADSSMSCPSGGSFWSLEYNGDNSRANQWVDSWFNYGNGWRGKTFPCSTNSGDTNDNDANVHPIITATCSSFTYSNWSPSICPASEQQNRNIMSSSPDGCSGGSPQTSKSCTYTPEPQTCNSFTYSDWSSCPVSGTQTRTVSASSPSGCSGGSPVTSKSCDCVDGKFKAYKYSDNYKKTCPANDWCQMGNETWWSWGNGWIGLNNETWYNYGTGWISIDMPCN